MTGVPAWECPSCGRRFGRRGQGHECAPALTLDEYFATGPPHERPLFDAVVAHLRAVGPVHVEPVSVGILRELARTTRDLSLEEGLRREADGFRRCLESEDGAEGVAAFIEKREPSFTGR